MHMLEQHQGKDHVSAQDQADENMAGSGSGVYLAEYKGEYMEVSMESANQLTVSAGALWVNGRFCIVDPAETLTVDNGSSGMTEYDLVCVHWKETTATQQVALAEGGTKEVSTTVEETELVIVKGDPASSGATDPEISQTTIRAGVGEAWVPFARITKDGLTPSVAFIVDKLVPESKFRDSISPTELTTLVNVDGKHKVTYEVRSGIVIVRGESLGDSGSGGTDAGGSKYVELGTMPEGLRPSENTFFYLSGRGGPTGDQSNTIRTDGRIRLYNTQPSGLNWWGFTCVYPV